jgi:hypothetical protein
MNVKYFVMILPQVHLRKPCYDFCPVQAMRLKWFPSARSTCDPQAISPHFLEAAQFRAATGGVYKGQGRNQRELMTCTYWEFLVQGTIIASPYPNHVEFSSGYPALVKQGFLAR